MDKSNALIAVLAVLVLTGGVTWFAMQKMAKPEPSAITPPAPVQTEQPVTPPAEQAAVTDEMPVDGEVFVVNQGKSLVQWYGERVVGNKHTGTLKIASGKAIVKDGAVTGGMFAIDMNSMAEKTESGPGMVIKHLMSADFFDVEKFPLATFVITKVTAGKEKDMYEVTGKLTIKGIENELTFPASIVWSGDSLAISKAQFSFDRTKWDIRYGSGKFFQDLGDKLIRDEISMTLDLTAEKQK